MGVIFQPARRTVSGGILLALCLTGAEICAQQRQQPPAGANVTRNEIDERIPDDPATAALIAPFRSKVSELDVVVGTLAAELRKTGVGAGTLGNFVTDAMRQRAAQVLGRPVPLAVTNNGGLRRASIAPGPVRVADIYELLPFENALVTVELDGEQLRKFLSVIVSQRDAQSGATLTYRTNEAGNYELASARLGPQQNEIDKSATYTLVTIDYLVKRGGDYSILQEAKNVRPLNLTLRQAVLDYIKAETAAGRPLKAELDHRFQAADTNPENE